MWLLLLQVSLTLSPTLSIRQNFSFAYWPLLTLHVAEDAGDCLETSVVNGFGKGPSPRS